MSWSGERAVGGGEVSLDIAPLSMISHELKSPLALIRQLSIELSRPDANIELLANQIKLSTEKSLRLTSNIAKSSTIQTNIFELAPVHPSGIVSDVKRELMPLYKAHGKLLSLRLPLGLPAVIANNDLLHRVLCNFADNALYYSDQKGIVELYCQLRSKDASIRMGIRDYGPMISKDTWKTIKINAASSSSLRPDSSGLGLVISHKFASAMNAKLGAIRHRNGASFFIDVPISTQVSLL